MRIYNHSLSLYNPNSFSLNEKQAMALEYSPVMTLVLSKAGIVEYANAEFYKVSGSNNADVIGKHVCSMMANIEPALHLQYLKNAIRSETTWEGEVVNFKKNGQQYHFSGKLMPVENDFNVITGFILTGQDITSFKETEQQLEKAVSEKNILLGELHHRVKNNLAIVSGLMQLQAINESDENVRGKLYESAGRVTSIASMHEVLYESGSLVQIDIRSIVHKIIQAVSGLYISSKIKFKIEVEDIHLNINQAHPFSLILNEMLSNAYKFSAETGKKGYLNIKVTSDGEKISLSISDAGEGASLLFKHQPEQKKNMGYELMKKLVHQLHGKHKLITSENGTHFHMQFLKRNIFGASNGKLAE